MGAKESSSCVVACTHRHRTRGASWGHLYRPRPPGKVIAAMGGQKSCQRFGISNYHQQICLPGGISDRLLHEIYMLHAFRSMRDVAGVSQQRDEALAFFPIVPQRDARFDAIMRIANRHRPCHACVGEHTKSSRLSPGDMTLLLWQRNSQFQGFYRFLRGRCIMATASGIPLRRRLSRSGKRIFARIHIALYRLTRGMVGHRLGPARILLLTTIGFKSGQQRTTPISYFADGEAYILVASNYGAATDPIWLRNLRRHPRTTIQVKARIMTIDAEEAGGTERERLATIAMRLNPTFQRYQQQTARAIPLVVLRPLVDRATGEKPG